VYSLFLLLLMVIGMPVAVAMIQNHYDVRKSRKLRSDPSCPPHQWVVVVDDIHNLENSFTICKLCSSRNPFNN
jgi:hypothetical protein